MTIRNTHTMNDLNKLIDEKLAILVNGKSIVEKRKARKEIIMLEKLIKDVDYKLVNGKKYPVNYQTRHADDIPMNKEELYKLIDSVDPVENMYEPDELEKQIDLSGVSVGKNRFEYVDAGWKEPKHPYSKTS